MDTLVDKLSQTRRKPRAQLSHFNLMIQGSGISKNRESILGDNTPSAIDLNTLEEGSMFVNSMGRIDNPMQEEIKQQGLRDRPESFLVNGHPTFLDSGKPPSILIVDDNIFNVYSLKLMIEESFHLQCDSAFSAKEAM